MKGPFLNSHGLRGLVKHRSIFDSSQEHNLDFISVLETGKHNFSTECLDTFGIGLHQEEGREAFFLVSCFFLNASWCQVIKLHG